MHLEVEVKFPVKDPRAIRTALEKLGCRFHEPLRQVDLYLSHPSRNFGETDEALRLRRSGEQMCVTYKGPKIDATTKTREEIEIPFDGGEQGFEQFCNLFQALGFEPVLEVKKTRQPGHIFADATEIEVAIDDVDGLGTFLELELITPPEGLEVAKQRLDHLAQQLSLTASERRGYLNMLLEKAEKSPKS